MHLTPLKLCWLFCCLCLPSLAQAAVLQLWHAHQSNDFVAQVVKDFQRVSGHEIIVSAREADSMKGK